MNIKTIPPSRYRVLPPAEMTFAIKAFLAIVTQRGRVAKDFNKNNPSVTASRATSLCTKEAKVTFAIKAFLATVCHPERSRNLRSVTEQIKVRSTAGIS